MNVAGSAAPACRGAVANVSRSGQHGFPKHNQSHLTLQASGVSGDAHCDDSDVPNERKVHLMQTELQAELQDAGFSISPGQLGENITTQGLALLQLPLHTTLHIGDVELTVTGIRNPCRSLEQQFPGITKQMMVRDDAGSLQRKTGIFASVAQGGQVKPGDAIDVRLPPEPHAELPVL